MQNRMRDVSFLTVFRSNLASFSRGVGKHYIDPVGPRPTGSIDPVGRHYIGPVGHKAAS